MTNTPPYSFHGQTLANSGLYYKPMTIINDNFKVIHKLKASLTDDARVVIYDRQMFIVQATGQNLGRVFSYRHERESTQLSTCTSS
jgi:hypothetical protein